MNAALTPQEVMRYGDIDLDGPFRFPYKEYKVSIEINGHTYHKGCVKKISRINRVSSLGKRDVFTIYFHDGGILQPARRYDQTVIQFAEFRRKIVKTILHHLKKYEISQE
jgi:hypothetical protein